MPLYSSLVLSERKQGKKEGRKERKKEERKKGKMEEKEGGKEGVRKERRKNKTNSVLVKECETADELEEKPLAHEVDVPVMKFLTGNKDFFVINRIQS